MSINSADIFAGQCDLVYYKGSSFVNTARVHTDFESDIENINSYASSCGVKVCLLLSLTTFDFAVTVGVL